jgi:ubiquinone/menaquinone biosynthesis C-methylase UbiE
MVSFDEEQTLSFYNKLFREFGDTFESLNWGSLRGQQLRFKILSEIGSLEGKRILDVGCGLGDYARWLSSNQINVVYTGIDLSDGLVNCARTRHPSLEFIQGSILDESILQGRSFDFVFASGIFYTYTSGRVAWMNRVIEKMWSLCVEGLSFNSLSTWSQSHDLGEFYADPVETISFCRLLTPLVVFRHDYHPRDFTLYLRKSG